MFRRSCAVLVAVLAARILGVVAPSPASFAAELVYYSPRGNSGQILTYTLDLQTSGTFCDVSADPNSPTFSGIAFDSANNLYAADFVNNRIMKFNSAGTLVNSNFITGLNDPGYISVAPNGDMYIINNGQSGGNSTAIAKWTAASSTLNTSFMTGLDEPTAAFVGSNGNLLVALAGTTNLISTYTTAGSLLNPTFISQLPFVGAAYQYGNNYIVNGDNSVIQFPITGGTYGVNSTLLVSSTNDPAPGGRYGDIASNGTVYNISPGTATIMSYDTNGTFITQANAWGDSVYMTINDVNAVPEPAGVALVGMISGGVWLLVKRRRA